MESKYCWRLTDNRHWDSPARMADGRIFTDWRSACSMNRRLAEYSGLTPGINHIYSQGIQLSSKTDMIRSSIEHNAITGDQWGMNYTPPPAQKLIVPVARDGVEILIQDLPDSIASEVCSGSDWAMRENVYGNRLSQGNVQMSDCGQPKMSPNDPRWGLCPDTMIFNLRTASTSGGNPISWLNPMMNDEQTRV